MLLYTNARNLLYCLLWKGHHRPKPFGFKRRGKFNGFHALLFDLQGMGGREREMGSMPMYFLVLREVWKESSKSGSDFGCICIIIACLSQEQNVFYTLKVEVQNGLYENCLKRKKSYCKSRKQNCTWQGRGSHLSLLTCPGGMQHHITNLVYFSYLVSVPLRWAKSSFWAWKITVSVLHSLHPLTFLLCIKSCVYK